MAVIDLTALPKPAVVQEYEYEAVVTRQKARFLAEWEALRTALPDLPAYDTLKLETDPAAISIQAESYREILLLARINEAARARLLAFATGSDLDQLAAFYDIMRMPGENDTRLKTRVVLAIQGRSTGGPKERYKSIAMNSDIRVESVEPYRVGRSPLIYVAVFSSEPGGVASADLLSNVRAALNDDNVRLANDEFVVASAVLNVVNLAADVWLLPDADDATVGRATTALREAWLVEQALGRDLIREWWVSKLMVAGVHKVTPATADVVVPPYEAVTIGTIELNLRGRAY